MELTSGEYNLPNYNVTKPHRTFQRFSFAPKLKDKAYSIGCMEVNVV